MMMKQFLIFITFILVAQLGLTEESKSEMMNDFGGKSGLIKVVDDFMIGLLAEPKTKESFVNTDQKHIKEQLVEQFCELMDGGCKYSGKSMAKAHSGLDIKRGEFNALVECLQTAMTKHSVPVRSQNKLLSLLAPMHKDIIRK